jgi:hypothetical protein
LILPVDPCGRNVDMLRSCYSTSMRFGSDQSQSSAVKWYWADAGAADLGIATPFCSRNYTQHGIWPDLGEVEDAPRPWRDGSFPIVVPGTSGPCGSREVWREGYDGTIPPAFPRNDLGLLPCCNTLASLLGNPTFGLLAIGPGKPWVVLLAGVDVSELLDEPRKLSLVLDVLPVEIPWVPATLTDDSKEPTLSFDISKPLDVPAEFAPADVIPALTDFSPLAAIEPGPLEGPLTAIVPDPSIRQVGSFSGFGGFGAANVAFTMPTLPGSLLYATISYDTALFVIPPPGWTLVADISFGLLGGRFAVYAAFAAPITSVATFTFPVPSAGLTMDWIEFIDAPFSAVDVFATSTGVTVASSGGPTAPTAGGLALAVAAVNWSNPGAYVWSGGFQNIGVGGGTVNPYAWQSFVGVQALATTVTYPWVLDAWAMVIVSFT